MQLYPGLVGCCGVLGLGGVGTATDALSFKKQILEKINSQNEAWNKPRNDYYGGAFVQFYLADHQGPTINIVDELGFTKQNMGVNSNTGHIITSHTMPMPEFKANLKQWAKDILPEKKKPTKNVFAVEAA